MSPLLDVLVAATTVANGLLAGLFFVFACAIAPGFQHLDDVSFLQAFRSINRTILNGWFLLVFFAAPLTAVAYALLGTWQTSGTPRLWAWTGATCAVLTFAITVARSVPLNAQLDRATDRTESDRQIARERFERRWNRWNLARTVTSIGALMSLTTTGVLV